MRWLPVLMMSWMLGVVAGCQSTGPAAEAVDAPTRVDAKMKVNGLSCPLCAHNVDTSLMKVPGIAGVKTDLSTGWVTLQYEDGQAPDKGAMIRAVADAGFTVAESPTGELAIDASGMDHEGDHDHGTEGHGDEADHGEHNAGSPGAMISDPENPVIKGYGVRVPVTPGETAKGGPALREQLQKLPGIDAVALDDGGATLWFTSDACLTEGQVKNAAALAGYTPGELHTMKEPRS